ncbi:MAG: hypothetical protein CME82_06365 [Halomonas sp.]|nr:hypothetical protein [Halomonas sp.]MBS8267190.1 hypothetical protein [Halomonas litopenaei]|tara:strand:- start:1223 stop:1999 length:777 start_codon:yes stop_codon:yes gene_type:complete
MAARQAGGLNALKEHNTMPLEIDFSELGIELEEDKAKALKEALDAKHEEALNSEVSGLKSKRDQLLESQKTLKSQLKQFEGLDPERARRLEQQLAENEEAQLIADGKLDEVLNKRTERMREGYDRQLSEAQQTAESAKAFADKFRGRVMSDEIRTAAAEVGIVDSAVQDAVYRASSLFEVDDEGNVVPREEAGLDADGKPLTPSAWLESMREKAPHWFPQPKGSGAPGGGGGSSAPRAWKDAKSTAEKVEILKRKQNQ